MHLQLAKTYGPVYSIKIGVQEMVVLSGYDVVKEALVNQAEIFTDRPNIPVFMDSSKGNDKVLHKMLDTNIEDMVMISDHSPVTLDLADTHRKGTDYLWRFPETMTKDHDFVKRMREWWTEFASHNGEHKSNSRLYWETAKAVLRGNIIAHTQRLKKRIKDQFLMASSEVRTTYITYKNSLLDEDKNNWIRAKKNFEEWAEKREQLYKSNLEIELNRYGDKAGKILANLARGRYAYASIMAIRDSRGQRLMDPKDINKELGKFYTKLYKEEGRQDVAGDVWLDKIKIPGLTDEELQELNGCITEEEISMAIKRMGANKAPGPDGFNGSFYKAMSIVFSNGHNWKAMRRFTLSTLRDFVWGQEP
ncbi:unnamed protein product [Ranitomeya imitator]|uniref:Uncharacterized protein n=1 Tax=Ranitomeya imitator TaxID=111125 RepID=A0ABN9L4Q7_9NEOB|nr:unnamed protein product [Ranitomeya imitator]